MDNVYLTGSEDVRRAGEAMRVAADVVSTREAAPPEPPMSLRDLFAAHAPIAPEWWRGPRLPVPRATWLCPERADGCTPETCCCPHGECDDGNGPERQALHDANHMRRETAWRYTYADALLSEREKAKGDGR